MQKLTKTQKLLAERNKKFTKMNKAAKRVAIAKDVLASLEAGIYKPEAGTYFKPLIGKGVPKDCELNVAMVEGAAKCKVCQRGALFASIIGFKNNLTVGEVKDYLEYDRYDSEKLDERSLDYFDKEQLELMEAAFECRVVQGSGSFLRDGWGDVTELGYKAINMYRGRSVKDRMIAICENLIKNKGTFVVE